MVDKEMMNVYLNRILPVVGRHLLDKKIVLFNLQMTYLIAEMFARCGVKQFLFFDSSRVEKGSNMALAYGVAGHENVPCSLVLEKAFRFHNQFEDEWSFLNYPSDSSNEPLIHILSRERPDLLIGGGSSDECRQIAFLSRLLGIPAVVFSFFPSPEGKSLISLVDPRHGLEHSLFDELGNSGIISQPSRLDFLETSDLAAAFAKAILLKETSFERSDIQEIIYSQGRNNVIHGKESWPWWVFYGSEKSAERMVEMIQSSASEEKERKPHSDQRLMLLGCGTASLLAGEAINFFKALHLIDCKPFSVYNPVRQLASTHHIGQKLKPFVLQDILSERLSPNANPTRVESDLGILLKNSNLELAASELNLSEKDPASIEKFKRILDWFRPTVVVVGIGRPQDDNYAATTILRERGIRHIVSGLFPLATHFKHIIVNGSDGPCYSCLQSRLPIDTEGAAELSEEQRQMFYGEGSFEQGTQSATIFETLPSVHSALQLAIEMSLSEKDRSLWFRQCLLAEQNCFVGANIRITKDGDNLYGVAYPGQVVVYSTKDLIGLSEEETCPDCGRKYKIGVDHVLT